MPFNLDDKTWGLIIIGLVFLGLSYLAYSRGGLTQEGYTNGQTQMNLRVNWISQPHPSGNHGDASPGKRLTDVVQEFGLPDMIDVNQGGVAIWKRSTLRNRGFCWERVEIHDEQIPHEVPAPHTDFLYVWYHLPVRSLTKGNMADYNRIVADIRALSESITFDPLKQVIRVRCHFMGAVAATLVLAKRIALQQAHNMYGPIVMSTMPGSENYDAQAYQKFSVELCNLHQPQHNATQIFDQRPGGNIK